MEHQAERNASHQHRGGRLNTARQVAIVVSMAIALLALEALLFSVFIPRT